MFGAPGRSKGCWRASTSAAARSRTCWSAAAAETRDLVVLHYDADFDRIAAVTGQACEWVVPAGSVE